MSNLAPTGVNKILVEKYGYEWVNSKAWRPGTAPEAEIPTQTSQEPVLISIPDPILEAKQGDPIETLNTTPEIPFVIGDQGPLNIEGVLINGPVIIGGPVLFGDVLLGGDEPPIVIDPIMPDPLPNPEAPVHDSRFDTVDNAIEFAEANGQGDLSIAGDGTITNRFGETMVYDSTGNLAPAPRDTPIMDPGIIF